MKTFKIIETSSTAGNVLVELVPDDANQTHEFSVSISPYENTQSSTDPETEIVWDWTRNR